MITINSSGSFKNVKKFLKRMQEEDFVALLHKYGNIGVEALRNATPVYTGLTANSWYYEVKKKRRRYYLIFRNSNIDTGVPVAILIQYGHQTGTGGWVEGTDYINPAIKPLFDKIAEDIWRMVKE